MDLDLRTLYALQETTRPRCPLVCGNIKAYKIPVRLREWRHEGISRPVSCMWVSSMPKLQHAKIQHSRIQHFAGASRPIKHMNSTAHYSISVVEDTPSTVGASGVSMVEKRGNLFGMGEQSHVHSLMLLLYAPH